MAHQLSPRGCLAVGRATAQRAAQWEQRGNPLPAEIVAHLLALEAATQTLGSLYGHLCELPAKDLCARLELPTLAAEPLTCAVVGWHLSFERLFSSVLHLFCEEQNPTHQTAREKILAPYLRRARWERLALLHARRGQGEEAHL